MTEKRKESRPKVLKGGKIISNTSALFDCVLREVSKSGARLVVESTDLIPERFVLRFVALSSDHREHSCRVVWRSSRELGVAFD